MTSEPGRYLVHENLFWAHELLTSLGKKDLQKSSTVDTMGCVCMGWTYCTVDNYCRTTLRTHVQRPAQRQMVKGLEFDILGLLLCCHDDSKICKKNAVSRRGLQDVAFRRGEWLRILNRLILMILFARIRVAGDMTGSAGSRNLRVSTVQLHTTSVGRPVVLGYFSDSRPDRSSL